MTLTLDIVWNIGYHVWMHVDCALALAQGAFVISLSSALSIWSSFWMILGPLSFKNLIEMGLMIVLIWVQRISVWVDYKFCLGPSHVAATRLTGPD